MNRAFHLVVSSELELNISLEASRAVGRSRLIDAEIIVPKSFWLANPFEFLPYQRVLKFCRHKLVPESGPMA